ncbi:hypothetical protein DMH27_12930 [Raoultella planticola]|nr:hypothetical protein [Raoultella planticola]
MPLKFNLIKPFIITHYCWWPRSLSFMMKTVASLRQHENPYRIFIRNFLVADIHFNVSHFIVLPVI